MKNNEFTIRKPLIKTHKIIVVLLILLGVSTYANNVDVRGYESKDCTGKYVQVESYEELWNYHKKTVDGKYWEFETYNYVVRNPDCYKFKTNEVVIVATITDDDSNSGGSSTPSKGIGNSDQPSGQGGSPDPLDILTDADNVAKHLCWLEKAKKLEKIKNWVGEDTDATWKGDHAATKESWRVKATDKIEALYGLTHYPYPEEVATKKDVFIVVDIFPLNILNLSIQSNIPFDHVLRYVHMHEYVHVLQVAHERDDDDDLYVPHPLGDKFVGEMEAYGAVDLWWEWKYGIKAPFNTPNIEKPEGFDVRRDRYIELAEKKRKGNLIVDEDADPPINEEEELEELEAYLENDVPYPVADTNTEYAADAATNFECEEE